jgi:hypothetical protein
MVRHIPGKHNYVADYLFRFMFLFWPFDMDSAEGEEEAEHLSTLILAVMDLQEEDDVDAVLKVFRSCHNSRVGHFGGRRTYNLANKHFPGHGIPIRVFKEELDAQCAICQKYRLGIIDNLAPVIRHLMPPHHRGTI